MKDSRFVSLITTITISFVIIGCGNSAESLVPLPEELVPSPEAIVIDTSSLPPHTLVDNSSLAPKNGNRIQLNSENPNLSKDECIELINAYRQNAGEQGQVSVHKPSQFLDGNITPWCVENFDGKGIIFNDMMFGQ